MPDDASLLAGYHDYVATHFSAEDDALIEGRRRADDAGLPRIHVSPAEGKLLHVLVRLFGAQRILEIGTLGGYSATWMARALPSDGQIVSLELDPNHAAVARANVDAAGIGDRVEIHVGPAEETLRSFLANPPAPFDIVFIDADKPGYPTYLDLSLPLLRSGGVVLADNTLNPPLLLGEGDAHRYNEKVAAHPELTSVIIPILRGEHLDGLTVSIKR